jgi:hypothetical protein
LNEHLEPDVVFLEFGSVVTPVDEEVEMIFLRELWPIRLSPFLRVKV